MGKDTQSRKWQLTINNPVEKGYTHDFIKSILSGLTSVIYWCMADEVGEQGTYHTHISSRPFCYTVQHTKTFVRTGSF